MVYLLKLFKKVYLFKKVVFLISSGKNQISPLLAPPGKNPSDAHGSVQSFLAGKTLCATVGIFFVYVHLRCIPNNLKKINKMSTLPP